MKDIITSKRGMTNEARNMTVHLLRFLRGESLSDIAGMLGIKTYSTVSSILSRTNKQLILNKALRKRHARLESVARKSQGQI